MNLQSELKSKIHEWRFTDLSGIESALDNALSGINSVKDKSTADSFSRQFEEIKSKIHALNHEVESMKEKVGSLRSEMEKQKAA